MEALEFYILCGGSFLVGVIGHFDSKQKSESAGFFSVMLGLGLLALGAASFFFDIVPWVFAGGKLAGFIAIMFLGSFLSDNIHKLTESSKKFKVELIEWEGKKKKVLDKFAALPPGDETAMMKLNKELEAVDLIRPKK